jgi:hypothetical protein
MISKIPEPHSLETASRMTRFQVFRACLTERQVSSIIFFMLAIIITTLCIVTITTYMHEKVHEAINLQFGMRSEFCWKIQGPVVIAYTQAIVPANYTYAELCNYACSALHMENEIVSYNLEGITQLLIAMFVIYGIFQHRRSFDKKAFVEHLEEFAQELEYKKYLKDNGL